MTACAHLWVDSGYRHCFICGMRMSDYLDQQESAQKQAPKVGSVVHHFDLAVEVHSDGSATATLSDPGSFDVPIAEAGGSTPELALASLAEKVTIPRPKPVLRVTNDDTGQVSEYLLNSGVIPGGSAPMGHYVGKAVVQIALDFGMADEMAAGAAETYDDWYHREDWAHADHWHDLVSDSEEWLNEHTEGGLWHWADGDFRFDATQECPDCGDQRFADPDVGDLDCRHHLSWD